MAKKMNAFLRKLLKAMPSELRNSLLRERLDIPLDVPPDIRFKMASTQDELEQSFKILHDAYVNVGLMKPDPSGLRVSLYHALPTSVVLTAQKNGVVLGTVTVIRDSPLGLPSDKVLDLNKLRKPGIQMAEISALAIKPEWRGKLFFPLIKYLYEMCNEVLRIDVLAISVHSDWYFFYEAFLLFQRIEDRVVDNYAFANFMPVVGEYLDLSKAVPAWRDHYADQPKKKNIFWYFTQHRIDNFDKNSGRFYSVMSPATNFETLNYFFNHKVNLFQNLTVSEYWTLSNAFQGIDGPSFLTKPESFGQSEHRMLRRFPRLSACLKGVAFDHLGNQTSITVVEVGKGGLKAFIEIREEKIGVIVKAKIQIGDSDATELKLKVRWREQNVIGFSLSEPSQLWDVYIQAIRSGTGQEQITLKKVA